MSLPSTIPELDVKNPKESLLRVVSERNPDADIEAISRAFDLTKEAHEGQKRSSGDPYFLHPVEVARIVADLQMDQESIIAALLHDTLEDTKLTPKIIEEEFGESVKDLVEGVTKLKRQIVPNATQRQKAVAESQRSAESLRKMLLAMARDVRVMVIKLADRLHNMRTIESLDPDRSVRIAQETLDIYAPLAARLGIWQMKWQLEDLSFKVLKPAEFKSITEQLAKSRKDREAELNLVTEKMRTVLDARGLTHAEITGRPKHIYSIYNKMAKQGVQFEEIYDLLAIRVIVDTVDECYLALGVVHSQWLPMMELFYDYIALPKPNGYRSLHTKVRGPGGQPIEVQIRTKQMHAIAEYGVAAHYAYKEGAGPDDRFGQLRQQLFDWSSDHASSSDFLRSLATDLFSEQVFVFTPKGDVIDLPEGSTPLDFAFRVHTDIGLRTIGAKVNGIMVPLSAKLQNGDVVELHTRSSAQPNLDWLEFTKSAHTRSKIRAYFRKRNKDENAQRGKEALERELRSRGMDPKEYLGNERMKEVAKSTRYCETPADVFARVGEGLTSVQNIVNKLRPEDKEKKPASKEPKLREGILRSDVDNIMLRRAKCCLPVPGDECIGYTTRGRGIMLHRRVCSNALHLLEKEPERISPIEFLPDGQMYNVDVKIISVNRQGLLMDISTVFGEAKIDVSGAKIRTLPNHTAEIELTVQVPDVATLRRVLTSISGFSDVISIHRAFGKTVQR